MDQFSERKLMKGYCQFCGGRGRKKANICFPFGSPSQTYRPDTYEVCTVCVKETRLFDVLPRTTMPEYGEYNLFIYYDCQCCNPDHALSVDEAETYINLAKCRFREICVDTGYSERFYTSIKDLKFPKKYVPNEQWRNRELDLISDAESTLKKRRAEIISIQL
jgi:hypothetical protein